MASHGKVGDIFMTVDYVYFQTIDKKIVLPFSLEVPDNLKGLELQAYCFSKIIEKYNEMLGFTEEDAQYRDAYIQGCKETVALTMDEISW